MDADRPKKLGGRVMGAPRWPQDNKHEETMMFRRNRDADFPLLRSERARLKRDRKEKFKNYLLMWSVILIPTALIWYTYFRFQWVAEFLGSRYQVARFKITFSLLATVLIFWGVSRLFKRK
jgi:hypothetical protein